MSFSETIFLFFLALIIFGPKKLPEIARQVGKALNEFRRASNEFKAQIEQEIANLEVENKKPTTLAAAPAPEGTTSRTLNAASESLALADASAASEIPSATLAASGDESSGPQATPRATEALAAADSAPADSASDSASASAPPASDPAFSDPATGSAPVTSPTAQESHA